MPVVGAGAVGVVEGALEADEAVAVPGLRHRAAPVGRHTARAQAHAGAPLLDREGRPHRLGVPVGDPGPPPPVVPPRRGAEPGGLQAQVRDDRRDPAPAQRGFPPPAARTPVGL